MSDVYVLQLQGGKFYVGKTNNVSKRYREHLSGLRSSSWTKKYRPIGIEKVFSDADPLDEDKITVQYMMEHGVDNVRGGPYVSIKLSEETKKHIIMRIRMASDLCVGCGSNAHFITACDQDKTAVAVYPVLPIAQPGCESCNSVHHFTEDCFLFE